MTTGLPFRFRPPWWGFALAIVGCAAGILLGNWQSGRAVDKRTAEASLKSVSLQGEFLARYTVLLENKLHRGRPGFHVIQPLRIAGSERHVLVNRGWIAAMDRREKLPAVRTPAGSIALQGLRLERFARAYEPPGARAREIPFVWQNASVEDFSKWSGLTLEPYVIEQHSELDDGLVRDWPRIDAGVEKHASYALQWYSLAGLSIVLFLVLNFKRAKDT